MAERYVNINGNIANEEKASVSHDNRAFRYGYGIFETMLVLNGTIRLKDLHFERLFAGVATLNLQTPKLLTPEKLEAEISRSVKKNGLERLCRVRLQLYAGPGGMFDATTQQAEFIIECFELRDSMITLNENGLVLGIAEGLMKSPDSLANLKSCNALIYAMAAQQAKTAKQNDTLICNTSGNIIESTIANVFWIKDDIIYTPPLSEGCVAGVMRRHLLAQLPVWGYTVKEQALTPSALEAADEVFLTNAIRGVRSVATTGDVTYSRHITIAIAHRLFSSYA